jgi:hypothetical protein
LRWRRFQFAFESEWFRSDSDAGDIGDDNADDGIGANRTDSGVHSYRGER